MLGTENKKPPNNNLETTTRLKVEETFGEDEITLVEDVEEGQTRIREPEKEEESVTLKVRGDRRHDPMAVARRIQEIEKKAKKTPSFFSRAMRVLEATSELLFLLDGALRKVISKIRKAQPNHNQQKKQTPKEKAKRPPATRVVVQKQQQKISELFFWKKKYVWITAPAALILLVGLVFLVTRWHHRPAPSPYQGNSESTLQSLALSPLYYTDIGNKTMDPKRIPRNRPVYANFDVLRWNHQEGVPLNFSVDTRIYTGKGKLEVFRPDMVKYSSVIDPQTEKVHVKTYLYFSNEAPPGEYRLSFTVREEATQRVSVLEGRVTVN